MEREKALLKYREQMENPLQEYRIQMAQHLLERAEQMEEMIKNAMNQLGEKMKEQGKEYVSFLYISLLKTDLIHGKYQFLLHAMNMQWYLDDEPMEVYFDAGDLLEPLLQIWDSFTEASREYWGVINRYDIQHILFEELTHVDATLSQILRYRLRDWEKKELFSQVSLSPYWFLKWGEYRDQTEFILQTDRVVKEESIWKEDLKKAQHKPETMIFGYWYQGQYKNSQAKNLNMEFSVFEECILNHLQFEQCKMQGSRFPGSSLSHCSFAHCNLWGADFTGCTFQQVSFQGAELTGALFPAESVPFLNLEPEQLQTILLKREADL